MRPFILICLFAVSGYAATAQFTVLPQFGLENSKTAVAVNQQSYFSPLGGQWSQQAAVRLDYAFKKMHGPFIELATSRSVVNYKFSDPQNATTAYTALRGNMQLRLEGGYQVTTKPLYFNKSAPATTSTSSTTSHCQKSEQRTGCSKYMTHSWCGGSKTTKTTAAAPPKDTRSWMRLQPAVGVAYIPGAPRSDIYQAEPAVYQYNAGNWTTAVVSSLGFEFGKGTERTYTISLNYLKGLGNLDMKSMNTVVDNKPITTTMQSKVSNWSIRMGIPISFGKKQAAAKQQATQKSYNTEKRCSQYKMEYHRHCSGY